MQSGYLVDKLRLFKTGGIFVDQILLSFDRPLESGDTLIKNNDLVWVMKNQKSESQFCMSDKICQGVVFKITNKKIQVIIEGG